MTKKDYIRIADTLIDSFKHCYKLLDLNDTRAMFKIFVKQFCLTLKLTNDKFNEDKFREYIDKRMGWLF